MRKAERGSVAPGGGHEDGTDGEKCAGPGESVLLDRQQKEEAGRAGRGDERKPAVAGQGQHRAGLYQHACNACHTIPGVGVSERDALDMAAYLATLR